MREIHISKIIEAVKELCVEANYYLSDDVRNTLYHAKKSETWPLAENILEQIILNSDIAKNENKPICQDTGMACVFLEIGQDVHIIGGLLEDAINEGVRRGYDEGFLRKSVVKDPINRINTKDNTPAIIYYDIVPGDKIKITVAPKGFGSENMSRIKMLKPSDGLQGVKDFIIETIKLAGPNPCPPIVIGVGIGGTFDKAAYLSKKALIRPLNVRNKDEFYSNLEKELLEDINNLGIGPQGFGGKTTAIGLNIETYPTHIAGLQLILIVMQQGIRKESYRRLNIMRKIHTPLNEDITKKLKAGDSILLSGTIYTARDAAHERLINLLKEGKELPLNIKGEIIYYVGPTPEKQGEVIGAAGPTTSYRMDGYTPELLDLGLKGMIGKGARNEEVINAIKRNNSIYFGAIGGAGALISKCIKSSKIIAYDDLGAEAIRKLEVKDMPLVVIIDTNGNNLYEIGKRAYLDSIKA